MSLFKDQTKRSFLKNLSILGLAGLSYAGLGIISGCQFDKCSKKLGNTNICGVDYDVANNLILNTSRKMTVVFEDEIKGIYDMRKILLSSPYEEMWLYSVKNKFFAECGIDEQLEITESSCRSTIDFNIDVVKNIFEIEDNIVHWHIHPVFRKYLLKLKDKSDYVRFLIEHPEFEKLPSSNDFSAVYAFLNLYKRFNKNADARFKICSYYGVTEFGIKDEFNPLLNKVSTKKLEKICHCVSKIDNVDLSKYAYLADELVFEKYFDLVNKNTVFYFDFTSHDDYKSNQKYKQSQID